MVGFAVYLAWLFYKISEAYLNQDLARHQEGLQKAQPRGPIWDHQISAGRAWKSTRFSDWFYYSTSS